MNRAMFLKKTTTFLIFLVIFFSSIAKVYSIEPDIFVQSTVNRASEALNNKYSKEAKIKKLKEIASETVDINGIGYYTLGAYRKNINEDQKKSTQIFLSNIF